MLHKCLGIANSFVIDIVVLITITYQKKIENLIVPYKLLH